MPRIFLVGKSQRAYAAEALAAAPDNCVVSITKPKRTIPQNDKMWAMLQDVARAQPDGRQHTTDRWKALFMNSLGHQCQFEQGLDDTGPIPMGYSSSQLNVGQMRDLIEVIYEYGARHSVTWKEAKRSGFTEDAA